jgi:prepilin-type N-terminal cleavage/methylation domain-containing protein
MGFHGAGVFMMRYDMGRQRAGSIHSITGFTLIEMMVVMLLISIILAVAIPRFDSGFMQDSRKTTTRRIIQIIKGLRSKAIGEQKTYSLVLDLSNDRYWTVNDSLDELTMAQAADSASRLPDDIHFSAVIFPNQEQIRSGKVEIQFHPGGYSDHALIHLQTDDAQRFTYLVQPLLPKLKVVDQWLSF